MASQFVEMFMAQQLGAMDPQVAMVRDFITDQKQDRKVERVERKAAAVENIEQKLNAARARGADQSVIGCFEKLLAELNA